MKKKKMTRKIFLYPFLVIVILLVGFTIISYFYLKTDVPCTTSYKIETKEDVKYFGQGYLKYREGIPFLYVKGDPYEIGLQYGVLLKEQMQSFYTHVENLDKDMMSRVYEESPWYMDIIIKISSPFVMKGKLNAFKKRTPDDLLSQLKGMSEGSGVPLDNILFTTFGPDMLYCSSFIKNVGGRFIHGRNADHSVLDFFSRYPLIAHYDKKGKYSYIDIGIIGTPWAVTGINEHGLTLSWSQATSRPFKGNGTTLMFNRILEECRNLSDVDQISKNVDRFVTMIGSLEDRTGAAYDIVGQNAVRTDLRDGYIFATNRCASPSMRKEYNSIFDMDWSNSARAYTYEKTLSNSGKFTIDDAIGLLSNTDFYDYKGKVPPYARGNINNRGTGSSVVCDPQNSTVYFAYGSPYAGFSPWIAYNYKADEVFVYKKEDQRLQDTDYIEYVELEKRWEHIDYDNKDQVQQMLLEYESLSLENFSMLHNSCWAWYELGDNEKAEAIIRRQIEKYPDFLTSYSNMGFLRMFQERFDEAIVYFNRALEAPITNERKQMYCYQQLAPCYAEIGDEVKSRECYSKVLEFYNRYWIPEQSRKEVKRIEALLRNRD